jgi:hypothetical protein
MHNLNSFCSLKDKFNLYEFLAEQKKSRKLLDSKFQLHGSVHRNNILIYEGKSISIRVDVIMFCGLAALLSARAC